MYVGYLVNLKQFPNTDTPHITMLHFKKSEPTPQDLYDLDMISDEVFHPSGIVSKSKAVFDSNKVLLLDDGLLATVREAFYSKLMKRNPGLGLLVSNDFRFRPHVTYNEPEDFKGPNTVDLQTPLVVVWKSQRGVRRIRYLGF